MDALARKLGLNTDPTIFFTSAGIMILFLVALLIAPGAIGETFGAGRQWIVTNLGWFFYFRGHKLGGIPAMGGNQPVRGDSPAVNIQVAVASLIRVFRPLVFRQIFPWRQVFQ